MRRIQSLHFITGSASWRGPARARPGTRTDTRSSTRAPNPTAPSTFPRPTASCPPTAPRSPTRPTTASSRTRSSWCSTTRGGASSPASPPSTPSRSRRRSSSSTGTTSTTAPTGTSPPGSRVRLLYHKEYKNYVSKLGRTFKFIHCSLC